MNSFCFSIILFLYHLKNTYMISPIQFEKTNQGFLIPSKIDLNPHYKTTYISSFFSLLDINANKTLIRSTLINKQIFNNFPQQTIQISTNLINCFLLENSIFFGDQLFPYEYCAFVNEIDDKYSTESLPLSHIIQNTKMSALHSLLNRKEISSLKFHLSSSNSKLYIGGLPKYKLKNYYVQPIEINPLYNTWGANLSSITFEYETDKSFLYINNFGNYSYFTTKSAYITVNKRLFDFIKENVLRRFIVTNSCSVNQLLDKAVFVCSCSILHKLPYIYFTFNNEQHIGIYMNKLFKECSDLNSTIEKSDSFIRIGYEKEYENEQIIEIGTYFLQEFEIEFDIEQKEINFYSKYDFLKGNILDNKTREAYKAQKGKAHDRVVRILNCSLVILLLLLVGVFIDVYTLKRFPKISIM